MRSLRHAAALVALGQLFTWTDAASAQTKAELDKARLEFQEGVALASANNCPAALAKFRSVARVKNTPQVAFNVAECEERMGRLAAALGDYRVAAKIAANDPKAADIYAKVSEKVVSLEVRVPKLTITRGKGAQTATISLDGVEIGDAQIGTEIPVDPGPHLVVGKIGDKEYARQEFTLAEKEAKTVEVVMNVPIKRGETGEVVDQPAEVEKGRSPVPGIVIASAGGVSMILGVVFIVMRGGTISDLDAICGEGQTSCPDTEEARSLADSGRLYTGLAEVTMGLGAVALVTGIVLAATAGPSKPKPPTTAFTSPATRGLSVSPHAPGASAFGASLVGRF